MLFLPYGTQADELETPHVTLATDEIIAKTLAAIKAMKKRAPRDTAAMASA